MKKKETKPMTAWATWPDGTKVTADCADGPATLTWMCAQKAAGATTTGYMPA